MTGYPLDCCDYQSVCGTDNDNDNDVGDAKDEVF